MPLMDLSGGEPTPDQLYLGGLMGSGGLDQDSLSSFLSAVGTSLMTSPRGAPLSGFAAAMAQAQKDQDARSARMATMAILKKAGFSDNEARSMSFANPSMAALALQAKQLDLSNSAGQQARSIMGEGDAPGSSGSGAGSDKASLGDPSETENKFVGALRDGGLTNPNGLGAVAAYGKAESGYSPGNVGRTWSDPSQSGQAGTSGGIMSWRNERLDNMRKATAGADDPISAQARFMLSENPALTQALQNAQSPQEAHRLMADAWKFAGYDQPGGEAGKRLMMTQAYANRFGQQGQPARVAGLDGTAADGEAQVQAAERATGMTGGPTMPSQRPVQVAQAGPATRPPDGASAADVPAGSPVGFAIPGQDMPSGVQGLFASKADALKAVGRLDKVLGIRGLSKDDWNNYSQQRRDAIAFLNRQGPLADIDAAFPNGDPRREQAIQRKFLGESEKIPREAEQRRALASQYGLKEGTEEYNAWVLGGKVSDRADAMEKADVKRIEGYTGAADAARAQNNEIVQMRELRKMVPFAGGLAPDARIAAGKFVNSEKPTAFGFVPSREQANAAEALKAKTTSFQVALSQGSKGAISDKEQAMFARATPGIDMTGAAAEKVFTGQEAINLRNIERGNFYQTWRQTHSNLQGADQAWDRYAKENPILSFDERNPSNFSINQRNIGGWERYVPGLSRGEDRDGGDRGPPQQRQQQAPAFSRDELAAEARRRGLVR